MAYVSITKTLFENPSCCQVEMCFASRFSTFLPMHRKHEYVKTTLYSRPKEKSKERKKEKKKRFSLATSKSNTNLLNIHSRNLVQFRRIYSKNLAICTLPCDTISSVVIYAYWCICTNSRYVLEGIRDKQQPKKKENTVRKRARNKLCSIRWFKKKQKQNTLTLHLNASLGFLSSKFVRIKQKLERTSRSVVGRKTRMSIPRELRNLRACKVCCLIKVSSCITVN